MHLSFPHPRPAPCRLPSPSSHAKRASPSRRTPCATRQPGAGRRRTSASPESAVDAQTRMYSESGHERGRSWLEYIFPKLALLLILSGSSLGGAFLLRTHAVVRTSWVGLLRAEPRTEDMRDIHACRRACGVRSSTPYVCLSCTHVHACTIVQILVIYPRVLRISTRTLPIFPFRYFLLRFG